MPTCVKHCTPDFLEKWRYWLKHLGVTGLTCPDCGQGPGRHIYWTIQGQGEPVFDCDLTGEYQ